MVLQNILIRTRLAVDAALQPLRSASARQNLQTELKLDDLEDRVLLSAVPVAMVTETLDAAPANTADQAFDNTAGDLSEQDTTVGNAVETESNVSQAPLDAPGADPGALSADASPESDTIDVRHELVFVDISVRDYDQLLEDLWSHDDDSRQIDVVLLTGNRDGIDQISEALSRYDNLDVVHIVSHGTDGAVKLGNAWLNGNNIDAYAGQIAGWGEALATDADVLFYGCDLAAGEDGQFLMESLGVLTRADVAASVDDTGHAVLGGDWDLEYRNGEVEAEIAFSLEVIGEWYGTLDITTGLIGHWDLDSDGGDASGNSCDGTLAGDAVINTDAGTNKVGPGKLALDGTDDYVDLSAHAATLGTLSQGTIAGWIRTSDTTATQTLFGVADHGDPFSFATFGVWNGRLFFDVAENGYLFTSYTDAVVADGIWHHIAVTVDASGNSLYIDGAKVPVGNVNYGGGDSASSTYFLSSVSNVDAVHIGVTGESGGYAYDFNGLLDDVRLYGRALAASDITELYNLGLTPTSTITVNTTGDVLSGDADTSSLAALIATPGSDGVISLREAITAANSQAGTDTIEFEIPDLLVAGAHTIMVGNAADGGNGALPDITDPVIIDGTTDSDCAGTPIIELDGTDAGAGIDGLHMAAGSDGSTIKGMAINRFDDDGISGVANSVVIAGNYVGTDVGGTIDRGNGGDGIQADGNNWTIGGTTAADRNVVSGNDDDGVNLFGDGHTVQGNFIGTNAAGTGAIANANDGVEISSTSQGNTIGGTVAGALNVISGNNDEGILINSSANNEIKGNYIGTDATGTAALGNNDQGISLTGGAANNTIGGTTAAARNVISGNNQGIFISGAGTDGNVVVGNYIGTDVTGLVGLGHVDDGIQISNGAKGNTIGGTTAAARNVIASSGDDGMQINGAGTDTNVVQGNYIGVGADGATALGQTSDGVNLYGGATGNVIGGTVSGAGNVIANSGGDGVWISDGTTAGNSIRGNQIYSNAGLGIDLYTNGVTANDAGDGDSGANDLQNFPVLDSAVTDGSTMITIAGKLASTASTTFRVEFFASTAADPSGYGEGQTYVGYADVTTNASGEAGFSVPLSASVAAGSFITATATDPGGNTSEFALNVVATSTNTAPTIALPGGAVNYTENDPAAVIDSTATVSDPDSADFDGGELTIDFTSGGTTNDRLAIRNQGSGSGQVGITGSYVTFEGTTIGSFAGGTDGSTPLAIGFNADADDEAVKAVMQNITFENVSENPSTTPRTVRFVLTDGDGGTSNIETETISIIAVNDDPTNAGSLSTDIAVPEDVLSNVDLSAIDMSDVDAGAGSLTLTLSTSTGGNLSAASGGGVTVGGSGTSTLTLTGTEADLNTFLNVASSIQYLHGTPGTTGDNADTIQVDVTDNGNTGTGGGGTINLGTVNVDIGGVNDAPVNTVPGTQTAAEETPTVIAGISISDTDAGAGNVTTRLQITAGVLNVTLSGSATFSAGANGTGDLTIQGTVADINATLASLVYTGNTDLTGVGADTLTVTTNDQGNTGSGGAQQDVDTVQVDITAVNDAPVVNAPGAALNATEQTGLAIHGTGFGVSDVDEAGSGAIATLGVGEGTITVDVGDSGVTITGGNGTGTVTLSGTVSRINNLLTGAGTGTITYLNNSNTPSATTTLTVTVNDQGNTGADPGLTGDGASEEDTNSQAINIAAVNDDPTNAGSLPTDIAVTEDVASNVDLSAIDLSDVDAAAGSLTVTLSTSTGGNLSASSGGGVTVGGSGTGTLTLDGTVSNLNTFLDTSANIQYLHGTPGTNGDNADTIQADVTDNGNTGSGGGGTVTLGTANIDIGAANDAPVNTVPGPQTVDEETPTAIAGISISDSDAGSGNLTTRLQVTDGVLNVTLSGGATISAGANGTADLTIQGTITDINDTVSSLTYTGNTDVTGVGADTLIVTTNDQGNTGGGGAQQDVDTVQIDITPVNDAPVVDLDANDSSGESGGDFANTWSQGGGPVAMADVDAVIADVDSPTLTSLMVSISGLVDGLDEVLAADTSGTSITATPGVGTLTLTGLDTVANYQQVLRTVTYDNTSASPTLGMRAITFVASDGTDASIMVRTTLTLQASDPPVITLPGGPVSYTENDSPTVIDSGASVTDSDSTDFDGGTLTVDFTANGTANDRLAIRNLGTGIGEIGVSGSDVSYEGTIIGTFTGGTDGSTPLVVTLNASAYDEAVKALMQNITYENVSENPSTAARTVRFVLADGDGGTSNAETETINVTALNDDPTNAGSLPTDIAVTEDVLSNVDLSAIDLSDVDAAGGNVTVTLATSTGGNLSATSGGGVTVGGSGTGTITLTGIVTDLNTFLDSASNVQYLHGTPGTNGNDADTIQVDVSDNGNTGTGGGGTVTLGTVNVDIGDVNDAPVNSVPGTQTVAEETATAIAGISISDTDAGAGNLTTRLQVAAGAVNVTLLGSATISAGSNGTNDLTIQGTVTDINATLATLVYTGNTDVTGVGADTLTVTTNDLGNTGGGGAQQDVDTVQIDIAAVNDAPVNSVPGSQVTNEDTPLVFSVAGGNGITISDVDAGSNPVIVTLTAANGTLTLGSTTGLTFGDGNGTDDPTMTFAGTIAETNAALDGMSFTPTPNFNGLAGIQITVDDQGNVGSGGNKTDLDTIDITVNPVNDAPALDLDVDDSSGQSGFNFAATFTENGGPVFVADADASLSDVDSATLQSLTVTITNLPDGVAESLSAVTGGFSISANYNGGTGVLTLSGADTVANYQQVLRTITYDNASQDPDTTARIITFVAFDGSDTSNVATTTLTIAAQNDAPVVDDQSFGIIENSPNGTSVGTIAISDPDSSDLHTFTVPGGSGATAFAVNASTGEITVADSTQLDYESTTSFTLQVQVTDDGTPNLSDAATITINLSDVNESGVGAISDTDPAAESVAENSAVGTAVGVTAYADDPDGGDTVNYSLDIDAGGRFTIDANTRVITIAGVLDAETSTSHTVTVRATSSDTSFTTRDFTITVSDVDEFDVGPVTDSDGTVNAVDENAVAGTTVGITASASDADATTNTITYSPQDDDGGRFAIDANTGVVTVAGAIDRETDGPTRNITVRATSADGSFNDQAFTINILDQNDNAPVVTPGQIFGAVEDAPNGTRVGTMAAADVDTVGSLQGWTIVGGNTDGIFAIDSATGEITIADNTNLDYETTPIYTLALTVSDGVNSSAPETVTINIGNVNEAPANSIPGPQVTGEDTPLVFSSAGGNAITVSDVDASSNPVIATLSATNGMLTLGSTTGLTFGAGDGADDVTMTFVGTISEINSALEGLRYDPTSDYNGPATIDIAVDDQGNVGSGGAKTDLDTINITVTPVNDAPVASDGLFAVDEHSPVGTPVGIVSASDVDASDVLAYGIVGGSGVFGIDPTTGEIIVVDVDSLVHEMNPSFGLSVEVEDATGATDTAAITILLVNVNDPPVSADDSYIVDSLDTLTVALPGVLANDVDPDGDTLTVLLVSGPSHGTLTLAADGAIEYTPDDGYVGDDSFTYRTTDGLENSGLTQVTATVLPLAPPSVDDQDDGDGGEDEQVTGDEDDASNDPDEDGGNSEEPDGEGADPSPTGDAPKRTDSNSSTSPITTQEPPTTVAALPTEADETTLATEAWKSKPVDRGNNSAHRPSLRRGDISAEHDDQTTLDRAARIQQEYGTLWSQLDTLQEDLAEEEAADQAFETFVVGTTAVSVTGLTVGYVLWLIRGGTLVASFLSSLPAWCVFDPLPVLESFGTIDDRRRDDDISFESLVSGANHNAQTSEESGQES